MRYVSLRRLSRALGLVFFGLLVPVAAAQDAQQPQQRQGGAFTGSPLFWRSDWILEAYVGHVTRYYNLNKEQEEYTRKLMGQRVKRFLETHDREVRSLIAEYWDYQSNQELPDPQTARDFARRAAPLLKEIRKEVIEGNMRWREILNEQQRAKHDNDLQQMTTFFDNLEQGLDRWKEGNVRPMDVPGRIGNRPPRSERQEDAWDFWLRTFITNYKLDAGQQETAQSILRELKAEAIRYRQANQARFEEIRAASGRIAARTPKTQPAELEAYQREFRELNKQRQELEQPISSLFDQLRARVEAIPTADQRRARQAQRSAAYGTPTTSPATRPATVPSTQP